MFQFLDICFCNFMGLLLVVVLFVWLIGSYVEEIDVFFDYVVEWFGECLVILDGLFSDELQVVVKVVFVDSME